MGCDIHMYVEKKVNDKWISAQGMVKNEEGHLDVPYPDKIFNDRNYELFGFLTGGEVRRDCGINKFPAKGFPEDASKAIKRIYKAWGSDAHTPSYLTLQELKSIDWEHLSIKESGMMTDVQWAEFQLELIKPEVGQRDYNKRFPYCQGVGGLRAEDYKQHEWEVPIRIAFQGFFEQVVSQLHWYDFGCKDDEVRIVFWFDN